MTSASRRPRLLLALFASALVSVGEAGAIIFNVDSILDQVDDDTSDGLCHTASNLCTLRAAVMQANVITGENVRIELPSGIYTLVLPPFGANGPESGDLNLTAPPAGGAIIEIRGASAASSIVDAAHIDRVLRIEAGRTALISRLTVRNGRVDSSSPEYGGGIYTSGVLTLYLSTVENNAMDAFSAGGGGIYNNGGVLHLSGCTVRGNTTNSSGGGIFNTGTLLLVQSTVSGNSAMGVGGGIADSGTLQVSQSTISANTAHLDGGGIYTFGVPGPSISNSTLTLNDAYRDGGGIHAISANLYSSTIVNNGADFDADPTGGVGGGLYAAGAGSFNLSNTVVAANTLFNAPIYDDCNGTFISYRNNIFGEVPAACVVLVGGGGGWTALSSLDDLEPLRRNGGPTATMSLRPGSNAIDGGDPTLGCTGPDGNPLLYDQRGAERARGIRCDIGAYESGTLFFDGFESGDVAAW